MGPSGGAGLLDVAFWGVCLAIWAWAWPGSCPNSSGGQTMKGPGRLLQATILSFGHHR